MARDIPFFEMFAELQLSSELRLKLAGAMLTGASIDQATLTMLLRLTVRTALSDSDLEELKQLLKAVYGFRTVEIELTTKLPEERKDFQQASAAPAGGKEGGKVLMGNPIKGHPGPMKDLNLKMGNATVAGKVFAFECRETRRPGMWRLSFDMTDYTNSVTVQKNLTAKEAQGLESAIKPGMWLCVQGKMEPTWDGKDIQLNP